MGLRFRRYIKLAPGIRMNFTGSGISWTLGPRGASLNIGKRGTYINTGIPGTGIYSRQRIDSPPATERGQASPNANISITVGVTDDGIIYFRDSDGNPLSDKLINAAKKQQADAIRGLIQNKCNEINGQIAALGEIHFYTPDSKIKPIYQQVDCSEPQPSKPVPVKYGLIEKIFKYKRDIVDKENNCKENQYQESLKAWHKEKQKFDDVEQTRKHMIEVGIFTDTQIMENFMEENLQTIVWPRETNVSAEVLEGGTRVFVDVDLPEIDEMPNKTAAVPQRGYKLSVKEMSPAQVQRLYMRHIHGIGFRIIGETFAVLPTVQEVVLSAYSQRPDRATGSVKDEYLLSVRVGRDAWSKIDFNNLKNVDVVEAISQFDLRRDMTKTGIFKPIEPYEPNMLDLSK